MVDPVYRDPENRPAFKTQRAADSEKVLQPHWAFVAPVGVQPVITHADSEARSNPIKEDRDPETFPAEHEHRRDGAYMEKSPGNRGWPIESVAPRKAENFCPSLGA